MILPCSAKLTSLLVAKILILGLPEGAGFSPMELQFPVMVTNRISTEAEVRWWYSCITEEVERMGSTIVRYLMQ